MLDALPSPENEATRPAEALHSYRLRQPNGPNRPPRLNKENSQRTSPTVLAMKSKVNKLVKDLAISIKHKTNRSRSGALSVFVNSNNEYSGAESINQVAFDGRRFWGGFLAFQRYLRF